MPEQFEIRHHWFTVSEVVRVTNGRGGQPTLEEIHAFKASAKSVCISQKRRSHHAAWSEFIRNYKPKQYYAAFENGKFCRDDTFQVYYTD